MELVHYTEEIMDESLKYTNSNHIWKVFGYNKVPNSNSLKRYIKAQNLTRKENFLRNEIFIFTFILMVKYTPNLKNRNKVYKYYLDILNLQDKFILRKFGFKSCAEISGYHYTAIQDYLTVNNDYNELVKVFSRRFKESVSDFSYESFKILFGASQILDLEGLEIYLDRRFGNEIFTDNWEGY